MAEFKAVVRTALLSILFRVVEALRSGVALRSNFKVERRLLTFADVEAVFDFAGAPELRMLNPLLVVVLMNLLAFFQGMRFFLKSYLTMSKAALSMSRPSNLQMSCSSTFDVSASVEACFA